MVGEAGGVDRGAGDDQLQVRALRQELLQIAEDEVDVEAALVGLVDDQRVVAAQQPVALDLGEQDAVGHHLDQRGVAHLVGEPDGVADVVAELRSQFVGDPLGDRARRDPTGLRVADHPVDAASGLETELGQLRALARAGLAGHDHHLVLADRCDQLVAAFGDRQALRVRQPTTGDDRVRSGAPEVDGGGRHGNSVEQPRSPGTIRHRQFPPDCHTVPGHT